MTLLGVPPMWNGIVDVRDVADAHILAAFKENAAGRYIISGGSLSLLEMGKFYVKILDKNFLFRVTKSRKKHLNSLDLHLAIRVILLKRIWATLSFLMLIKANRNWG
jgi:nucleoside-diphosphate-sugar epimerase